MPMKKASYNILKTPVPPFNDDEIQSFFILYCLLRQKNALIHLIGLIVARSSNKKTGCEIHVIEKVWYVKKVTKDLSL